MTTTPVPTTMTTAFYVQAAISFGVALTGLALGVLYLPADRWVRAFLGLGVLYAVTSSFTLAKCVRDQQESAQVRQRVDEARLDKLIVEHDPFRAAV